MMKEVAVLSPVKVPLKTFLVAVKSAYVKEVYVTTEVENALDVKMLEDVSAVIGTAFGQTDKDAIEKIGTNHRLPVELLVAYEIA